MSRAHAKLYFPFYAGDYLSDEKVRGLTFEERGVYVELLCLLWKTDNGKLNYDLERLSRMLGISAEKVGSIMDVLTDDGNSLFKFEKKNEKKMFFSSRLLDEKAKIERMIRQKRRAAKSRWDKDSHSRASIPHDHVHRSCITTCNANQNQNQNQNIDRSPDGDFFEGGKPKKGGHYKYRVGEYVEKIDAECEALNSLPKTTAQKKRFNPFEWVQTQVNSKFHPRAIIESLEGLKSYWDEVESPWGYADVIMKTKSGNYYEADHIRQSQTFKAAWNANPKVKKIIERIGG